MKQINECLDRYFANKKSLKRKWQVADDTAEFENGENKAVICLYHYEHLILIVDKETYDPIYKWYEVKADKMGMLAALEYFKRKKEELC